MTFQMQNDIFDGVKKEPPCHIAFLPTKWVTHFIFGSPSRKVLEAGLEPARRLNAKGF